MQKKILKRHFQEFLASSVPSLARKNTHHGRMGIKYVFNMGGLDSTMVQAKGSSKWFPSGFQYQDHTTQDLWK